MKLYKLMNSSINKKYASHDGKCRRNKRYGAIHLTNEPGVYGWLQSLCATSDSYCDSYSQSEPQYLGVVELPDDLTVKYFENAKDTTNQTLKEAPLFTIPGDSPLLDIHFTHNDLNFKMYVIPTDIVTQIVEHGFQKWLAENGHAEHVSHEFDPAITLNPIHHMVPFELPVNK